MQTIYLFANSISLLLLIRFIHGLATGFVYSTIFTAAVASLPLGRRGEGNGYFSLSIAASTALGPFLAVFLTVHFSYFVLFILCIACNLIALIGILFTRIIEATPSDLKEEQPKKRGFRIGDFFEKKAVPLCGIVFLLGCAYSSILSLLNAYAIDIGLKESASLFFLAYAIILCFSRPLCGRIYDKKGENIVVVPSFVMYSVSFFILASVGNLPMMMLSAAFMAFGYGTLFSSLQTVVVRIAPVSHMGIAVSTFFVSIDAGLGIGAYLNGIIIDLFNFRQMYMILGVLVICLLPVYWFMHGKKQRKG
jgi:predicted MFS family arabinose efflux permease